jgi:hypothetical protein
MVSWSLHVQQDALTQYKDYQYLRGTLSASFLKTEETNSSEMLATAYETAPRHNPEDQNLSFRCNGDHRFQYLHVLFPFC